MTKDEPSIDLNNLFKYAVPKLHTLRRGFALWDTFEGSEHKGYYANIDLDDCKVEDQDPALALFWALWRVKEIKE